MNIPFLDLKAPHQELRVELREAFERVLDSGWYILGDEVKQFEQEFAKYCGLVLNVDNTYGTHLHDEKVRHLLRRPPSEILTYLYTHVSPFHLQCALVKRSLLLKSNAFDSSALADDWLTNIRMFEHLAQEGHCAFVDQIVCYYRVHGENLHQNSDRQIALLKQTIERYTPVKLKHLAIANIYWDIGLSLGKAKPLESIKYLFISQLNHFRPLVVLNLVRRAIWFLCKKFMQSIRTQFISR